MYNRYLADAAADTPPLHNETPPEPARQSAPPQGASVFSELTRGLSGRLQNLRLDTDTVLVLAIVWFLLSDGDDTDWELFLMIGALLVLGI